MAAKETTDATRDPEETREPDSRIRSETRRQPTLVLSVVWSAGAPVWGTLFPKTRGHSPVGRHHVPQGLPLNDATLSREHFGIKQIQRGTRLEVDGIRKPISINETARQPGEGPFELGDGDVIRAGTTLFVVHRRTLRTLPTNNPAVVQVLNRMVGHGYESTVLKHQLYQLAREQRLPDPNDRTGPQWFLGPLLLGRTGRGKDVAALLYHQLLAVLRGRRGVLVNMNSGAISPRLFEGTVFGVRGGFMPDVPNDRPGILDNAAGGTLVINELGDLPLEQQPKFLLALGEGTYTPVGGEPRLFRAAIVSATERPLEAMVERGEFREALFDRLARTAIEVPALSARREDIAALAEHFRNSGSAAPTWRAFDAETLEALITRFPHDVRRLKNLIEDAWLRASAQYPMCDLIWDFLDALDSAPAPTSQPPSPDSPAARFVDAYYAWYRDGQQLEGADLEATRDLAATLLNACSYSRRKEGKRSVAQFLQTLYDARQIRLNINRIAVDFLQFTSRKAFRTYCQARDPEAPPSTSS